LKYGVDQEVGIGDDAEELEEHLSEEAVEGLDGGAGEDGIGWRG
jgi:hypothetical protein